MNWDSLVRAGIGLMVDYGTAMVLASLRNDVKKYEQLDEVKTLLAKNEYFKNF